MIKNKSAIYQEYCRPKLGALLARVRLDIVYKKASGDYLFYEADDGSEVKVVDYLGGYGAGIFGHNHAVLTRTAIENYENCVPFNAQGSVRVGAALLAEKLNALVPQSGGKKYIVTFANSGTEAVEAAIKHSELARRTKVCSIARLLEKRYSTIAPSVSVSALDSVRQHNENVLSAKPVFIAFNRAFHGKTTGALQLTYNKIFREPFSKTGISALFADADNPETLQSLLDSHVMTYQWPSIDQDGKLSVTNRQISAVSAIFAEPIQGEGGIIMLSPKSMKWIRECADAHKIPLVFDEIQSGMGRTGTFTYSEQMGVTADYYLLSKSLGGGIAKISALLVREDFYEEEFGFIHSSTFAEDDHSANIACRSLELLETDNIPGLCREKGALLLDGLCRLRDDYPGVVKDIRGAGLMIGVEFQDFSNSGSTFLQMLSEQKILGYVIAGYLLHEHRIRVAPALSSNSTIRLEPSAYISTKEIAHLFVALRRLCEIITKQNIYEILKFAVHAEIPDSKTPIKDFHKPDKIAMDKRETSLKVAFIGHLIEARHMCDVDDAFTEFTEEQLQRIIDLFHPVIGPTLSEDKVITSITGSKVRFQFLGLFLTSKVIEQYMRKRETGIVTGQIQEAVDRAIEEGCRAIGFGGFTSIVTNNCQLMATDKAALTSGNSLTVAMGVDAMLKAAASCGLALSGSVFAAVGAAGNIASTYSEIMAEYVSEILLFGRLGREKLLRKTASQITAMAYEQIAQCKLSHGRELSGIAHAISESQTVTCLLKNGATAVPSEEQFYTELLCELKDKCPVRCSSDLSLLSHADLILGASNSAEPVIFPAMLKKSPVVICDIAVPPDVHPSVIQERSDVTVLQGGIVKLPMNPDFSVRGIPLEKGELYACMSETTLMGLDNITGHYSYGPITKGRVHKIMEVARKHGFSLGRLKMEKSF